MLGQRVDPVEVIDHGGELLGRSLDAVDALAQFGVPIEGFRHPAPETGESWSERLTRLFGRLTSGDVVVVADKHALGRTVDEETHAIGELRRRGIIVKVLGHSRL